MKKETITKAIDYLRKNGDDQVFISFYGGEPLIAFDSMKYAIDYATKNIKEKELHFGFTTNLTLMTKEKAEYLVRIPNLHIVCSIDGPEEIHNMNRVYAGGEGTYRDVVRGLKFLKEALTQVEHPSVKSDRCHERQRETQAERTDSKDKRSRQGLSSKAER